MEKETKRMVYTTEEVAQILGLSIQQVYRLTRENEIPHKRIGKRRLVFPTVLINKWINTEEKDELKW